VSHEIALDDDGKQVQLIALEALPLRRRATDLRALLRSKLAVLSSQALAARVALNVQVADEVPPEVQVDSEKVAWAVTTLIGSALRYVQSGPHRTPGQIDVRASYEPPGAELAIEIRDNGPGIPSDSVARLFKRDGLNVLGTGLALLVMADVCAAHGGRIDVRSSTEASNHGTTVRLTFAAA
jgi:two-component system sensor histidine kinase QseC